LSAPPTTPTISIAQAKMISCLQLSRIDDPPAKGRQVFA
jgi:hypothetical protein